MIVLTLGMTSAIDTKNTAGPRKITGRNRLAILCRVGMLGLTIIPITAPATPKISPPSRMPSSRISRSPIVHVGPPGSHPLCCRIAPTRRPARAAIPPRNRANRVWTWSTSMLMPMKAKAATPTAMITLISVEMTCST